MSNDEEPNTIRTSAVFLSVDLCLCAKHQLTEQERELLVHALSAIADTSLLTGMGRLNIILDDIACWRMKLLLRA